MEYSLRRLYRIIQIQFITKRVFPQIMSSLTISICTNRPKCMVSLASISINMTSWKEHTIWSREMFSVTTGVCKGAHTMLKEVRYRTYALTQISIQTWLPLSQVRSSTVQTMHWYPMARSFLSNNSSMKPYRTLLEAPSSSKKWTMLELLWYSAVSFTTILGSKVEL